MNLRLLENTLISALLVFFYALLPGHVLAATTAVTIAVTSGAINFGSFSVLAGCSNCSITVSPAGVRTVSGAIVLTSAGAGSPATFTVTQSACTGANPKCTGYTTAVASPVVFSAGGVNMSLGAFTFSQAAPLTGTNSPVVNTLKVGATLTIPSRPTAGTFSGWGFTLTTTP